MVAFLSQIFMSYRKDQALIFNKNTKAYLKLCQKYSKFPKYLNSQSKIVDILTEFIVNAKEIVFAVNTNLYRAHWDSLDTNWKVLLYSLW